MLRLDVKSCIKIITNVIAIIKMKKLYGTLESRATEGGIRC